jgi:hypothetical protein
MCVMRQFCRALGRRKAMKLVNESVWKKFQISSIMLRKQSIGVPEGCEQGLRSLIAERRPRARSRRLCDVEKI